MRHSGLRTQDSGLLQGWIRDPALFAVIALAAATNFAYLWSSNGDYFYPDSATYLLPAHNLVRGIGFIGENGLAETLRTPGYPLVLALFGLFSWSAVPVLVFQHLLNVAVAAGVYLLARRRLGSRSVAVVAAVIFALDTPSLHHANKILSEATFTALLFGVVVLTLRIADSPSRRLMIVDGLLIGVLVMFRPVAIAYLVPVAIFFAMTRTKGIALFVLAAIAIPLLWSARNYGETGVFTVASIAGTNLMLHRGAGAMAMEVDDDFKPALAEAQGELLERAEEELEAAARRGTPIVSHAARSVIYARIGRQALRAHPRGAVLLTVRGLLVNAFDSDWDAMMIVSRVHPSIVQLAVDAATAIVFAFAFAGLFALWHRDRPLSILIALTVAYFLFLSAGGEAEARFRAPVAPLIAIAAAASRLRRH